MDTSASSYKSIGRVGDILNCLTENINTVTEIANRLGLSKSTASRLLKALEESSLVTQDPTSHKYYLGSFITKIYSSPTAAHMELVQQSVEEMERLASVTQETVFLGVLVGIQYIRLNEIVSKQDLRVYSEKCDLAGPQYRGAVAKVLLSQLNGEALDLALSSHEGSRAKGNPGDKRDLIAQLAHIRRQGYAISRGERVTGIVSMAVPVANYSFPASLGLLAPELRLGASEASLLETLVESGRILSDRLRSLAESRRVRFPQNVD